MTKIALGWRRGSGREPVIRGRPEEAGVAVPGHGEQSS